MVLSDPETAAIRRKNVLNFTTYFPRSIFPGKIFLNSLFPRRGRREREKKKKKKLRTFGNSCSPPVGNFSNLSGQLLLRRFDSTEKCFTIFSANPLRDSTHVDQPRSPRCIISAFVTHDYLRLEREDRSCLRIVGGQPERKVR